MKLANLTQKTILTNNLILTKTLFQSSIGLLNQPQGTTMLFKTRWGIHTFGMRYPIHIIVLNNQFQVMLIKKNLPPNRIFFWNPFYPIIIELSGSKKIQVKINDILKIDP